jgi:hypothetical protein
MVGSGFVLLWEVGMTRSLRAVAVVGALLLPACGTTDPSPLFSGSWSADIHVVGSSLVVDLSQSGPSITGSGHYAIEAGRSGTLAVSGSASGSNITFNISYDYGPQATYRGSLASPTQMVGTIQYTNETPVSLAFTKTQ